MDKNTFLQQLEAELAGATPDERVAALQYYAEYFDDAGPEREKEVLAELGSPQKVASDIRAASGTEEGEGWTPPARATAQPEQSAQTGTEEAALQAPSLEPAPQEGGQEGPYAQNPTFGGSPPAYPPPPMQGTLPVPAPAPAPQSNSTSTALLILVIVLAVLFAPALVGLLVSLIVVLAVPIIVGVALVASSITIFIVGVSLVAHTAGSGLLVLGTAVMLLAGGVMLCALGGWLLSKVLPGLFRGISTFFRNLTGRRAEA